MLTVIGLGNLLRGDDAVGPYTIGQLRNHQQNKSLNLIDAGADAFLILDQLLSQRKLILIDSARMGLPPGTVKKIELGEDNLDIAERSISLHGFGFADIYKMALQMGGVAKCILIGIEPKHIEFNKNISDEVMLNVPKVIQLVIEESQQYDKEKDTNH